MTLGIITDPMQPEKLQDLRQVFQKSCVSKRFNHLLQHQCFTWIALQFHEMRANMAHNCTQLQPKD